MGPPEVVMIRFHVSSRFLAVRLLSVRAVHMHPFFKRGPPRLEEAATFVEMAVAIVSAVKT
jgi:hypothetical protein